MANVFSNKRLLFIFFFFMIWWSIGIMLAFFWGLGWFFLFGTLRRIIIYFPFFRNVLHRKMQNEIEEINKTEAVQPTKKTPTFLEVVIISSWILITVIVFYKVNIPLIDIFL